tara:strand:- start:394 stop:531 length:138 start_codon:yes stop_codon:yes gene_type:complete
MNFTSTTEYTPDFWVWFFGFFVILGLIMLLVRLIIYVYLVCVNNP